MRAMELRFGGLWRVLWLLLLFPVVCWAYEVADIVEGKLAADGSNHYTVDTAGVLVVALITVEGDADLYASTDVKEPAHSDSQFSSSSYGLDLVVVPSSKEQSHSQRVYLSVVGHGRHEMSQYKMFIITPSNEDIMKYQVWDWDPESGRDVILVNYDPLQIANDPTLHQLLEQLSHNTVGLTAESQGAWSTVSYLVEWALYLFLETLKIVVEILF